ncbi:BMC domain-containing protein [Salmonella enterica]|nr:BMC domain-containing protein [Salmonella enterica]
MPALDLIRPSVTAMRVIASVNDGFARELKLPPHIRSLGLITADSDDVTYIAADEATKQAMVEVVYGRSLYAGAAHGPSPTAGEVLIMLGGPNPAEVRAGLDAMVASIENGAACRAALDAGSAAAQRTGRVISRKEIGRPEEDTQWLIGGFARATTPTEKAPQVPATPEFAEALLALLASVRQGMTAGEVAAHFGWPLEQARNVLEQLFSDGALRKRSSRYRIKN